MQTYEMFFYEENHNQLFMENILKAENHFIQYRIKLLRGIATTTMIIFNAFISMQI
jgi:hypothetical protein